MTRFQRVRLLFASAVLVGMVATFARCDLTPQVHRLNLAPARLESRKPRA